MGFLGKLFGGNKGMSLDDAAKVQADVQSGIAETDDVSKKINAAARLMTGRKFVECIAAYEAIASQHPDHLGEAESQIGAAYYFLGQYEKALEYYKAAVTHGADADMMKDNIDEANEAIAKRK